jgi:hypothetical protein
MILHLCTLYCHSCQHDDASVMLRLVTLLCIAPGSTELDASLARFRTWPPGIVTSSSLAGTPHRHHGTSSTSKWPSTAAGSQADGTTCWEYITITCATQASHSHTQAPASPCQSSMVSFAGAQQSAHARGGGATTAARVHSSCTHIQCLAA